MTFASRTTTSAEAPTQAVYTRSAWSGEWVAQNYLFATRVQFGSGSRMSHATLEWDYGRGIQADQQQFATYAAKDLINHYVKVVITPDEGDTITWHGVITESARDPSGPLSVDSQTVPTGLQSLTAYGLEFLLDRVPITTSRVRRSADGVEYTLQRALTFNAENAFADTGNRTADRGEGNVYAFTDDLDSASRWSTQDIVEHLVEHHRPTNALGNTLLPIYLSGTADVALPDWDRPVIRADGQTFFSLLNQLCSRRRNLGWTFRVSPTDEVPEIHVYTLSADTLLLPGGGTSFGNSDFADWDGDFDDSEDVQVTLTESENEKVEQVIVRGGHKRTCVSFSALDGTLEKDWTSAKESAYEAGPSFSGEETSVKEVRIRRYRQSDEFERVFSWFRVPPSWTGAVGDGKGTGTVTFFPEDSEHGAEQVYWPEMRFGRHLPRGLVANPPDGSPDDMLPPFALIRVNKGGSARYEFVDRLGACADIEDVDDDGKPRSQWSCSLRMQHHAPGIILRVSSGQQHMIADSDFLEGAAPAQPPAELDWQDNLIVTVMLELDSRVEERHPATDTLDPLTDVSRVVTIDLQDKARLDYVTGNTVIGVDDGVLLYPAAAYYIRDDRTMMQDLARFVYEWYGTPRKAFSFVFKQVKDILAVGQLLGQIGGSAETQETVNTVVTGVTIDLQRARMQVTTGFAELDFTQI